MKDMFDEKIALFHKEAKDQQEALKLLCNEFVQKVIVEEDFYQQILLREKEYSTGIRVNDLCIALPHTDPEYTKRCQVGFLSLKEPVEFVEMGSDDQKIPVKMIFMFAIDDTARQLDFMSRLMEAFKNEGLMKRFEQVEDIDTYLELIREAGF